LLDLIDRDAELARLSKEISKNEKERARCQGKLNNPSFLDKAPEAVVQATQQRAIELNHTLDKLRHQQEQLS